MVYTMTYRRSVFWSDSMHELSRDRATPSGVNAMFAALMQRARTLQALRIVQSRPLLVHGAYDLSAIMSAALADARV